MGQCVLVVDSEPGECDDLSRNLSCCGYTVKIASSGAKALEALRADCGITLALVDMGLVDMGGLELLEKMRFQSPHVRVILMAALPAEDVMQRAWQWGAMSLVGKPVRAAELFGKIEEAFARETIEQA